MTPRTPGPLPGHPPGHLERARAWVEALTGALEAGDPAAAAACLSVGCSWQPGPFEPLLRGRDAILVHLAARLAAMPALDTRAEILGAGETYAVVRWTLAWNAGDRGFPGRADGILLVALDRAGRATAVREWTLVDRPAS